MTQVAFVYSDWSTRYPEFSSSVNATQAADCFLQATLYLDNSDGSIVQDIPTRTMLLYMVTAHVAALNFGTNTQPASPLVGRIDSATQGSVSVSAKMPDQIGLAAWFGQTRYGAQFWAATARYRVFQYVPARHRSYRI